MFLYNIKTLKIYFKINFKNLILKFKNKHFLMASKFLCKHKFLGRLLNDF